MTAPDSERERIFDAFRHWGYLEADLDPLGFLPPQPHPDLLIDGEFAEEARRVYCGTVGAEFMHITDPERRRWIQERLEGPPAAVDQDRALDLLIRADLVRAGSAAALSGQLSASRSKATRRSSRWWMRFSMAPANTARWNWSWA